MTRAFNKVVWIPLGRGLLANWPWPWEIPNHFLSQPFVACKQIKESRRFTHLKRRRNLDSSALQWHIKSKAGLQNKAIMWFTHKLHHLWGVIYLHSSSFKCYCSSLEFALFFLNLNSPKVDSPREMPHIRPLNKCYKCPRSPNIAYIQDRTWYIPSYTRWATE